MIAAPKRQVDSESLAAVVVREATPEELLGWDALVARFDQRRIFHKRSWIESVQAFSGARPLYLIFERVGDIVGLMPGFLCRVGFLRIFGSPREGWQTESMGPVFAADRISTEELVGGLIAFLEGTYGVHHIELASSILDHQAMQRLGFHGELLFAYRVPLYPREAERVLRNFEGSARRQLRKAMRLGLTAHVETEEEFVNEFYDQLKEVFARRGRTAPFSHHRALQLFRHAKRSGNLLALSIRMPGDAVSIATAIVLVDPPELHIWGWTHRTSHRWYCPTELLTWTAMQKGMEAGCLTLFLAGGGKAKEKFGSIPDETNYRWLRSRYPWLSTCRTWLRKTYRLQQSMRGKIRRRLLDRNGAATAKQL